MQRVPAVSLQNKSDHSAITDAKGMKGNDMTNVRVCFPTRRGLSGLSCFLSVSRPVCSPSLDGVSEGRRRVGLCRPCGFPRLFAVATCCRLFSHVFLTRRDWWK